MRIRSCRGLGVENVHAPLVEEGVDIHIKRRSWDKYLGVSEPPQAFIALRAIRRSGEKVAFLPPYYAILKLVYEGGRADKGAGWLHIIMHYPAYDPIDRRLCAFRESTQLHISESMIGEQRRPISLAAF